MRHRLNSIKIYMHTKFKCYELKNIYLKWVFTALIFLQTKSVIIIVIINFLVTHGSEIACDAVSDINIPLCISFVFSVNSKHKKPLSEKSHIIHFHE